MTTAGKKKKNRAPLFLNMGLVGFASLLTIMGLAVADLQNAVTIIAVLAMIGSLIVMFFTRNSDEYTAELWLSGANAAFISIVAWLLIGPLIMGFMEGYNAAHEGRDSTKPEFDKLYAASSTIALFAFYITFHIKRLTGAL